MLNPQEKVIPLGIYCHVPFCASTCDFCAFYQEKPRREDLDRYLFGMEREFAALPTGRAVETVFWGGGTPGLLPAKDLERMGRALLARLPVPPVEWTVEMAPSTVKADKLEVLKALGVTRISMGVQSFDPVLLKALGRLHQPKQIYQAWERIINAGFPHQNMDLIFAIPGQTVDAWIADLNEAMRLGPDHISTYCLTFEEDTKLYLKLARGQVRRDEAQEIELLEAGWDALAAGGFAQYEISNFAKSGGECLHNVRTWEMSEWIGCGPSAASQYGARRFQWPGDLDAWSRGLDASAPGRSSMRMGEVLEIETLVIDSLIFGLRMNRGVNLADLRERFGVDSLDAGIDQRMQAFTEEGLLQREGEIIRLTHAGRLVCDGIGADLIEVL